MLEKANVDMIHPFHLKEIEQTDRSLVLPLYHQTIMYYIEQKIGAHTNKQLNIYENCEHITEH